VYLSQVGIKTSGSRSDGLCLISVCHKNCLSVVVCRPHCHPLATVTKFLSFDVLVWYASRSATQAQWSHMQTMIDMSSHIVQLSCCP